LRAALGRISETSVDTVGVVVAESTVELTGSRFEFRRVGELPIRGRRQSVVVYRVIGPHNSDETMPV
jgi:class 3 adenylate cyclase